MQVDSCISQRSFSYMSEEPNAYNSGSCLTMKQCSWYSAVITFLSDLRNFYYSRTYFWEFCMQHQKFLFGRGFHSIIMFLVKTSPTFFLYSLSIFYGSLSYWLVGKIYLYCDESERCFFNSWKLRNCLKIT